jgi:hypothetical protein
MFYTAPVIKEGIAMTERTSVPCSRETVEKHLRPLKRGGETYDQLLKKMADQYDPEEEQ